VSSGRRPCMRFVLRPWACGDPTRVWPTRPPNGHTFASCIMRLIPKAGQCYVGLRPHLTVIGTASSATTSDRTLELRAPAFELQTTRSIWIGPSSSQIGRWRNLEGEAASARSSMPFSERQNFHSASLVAASCDEHDGDWLLRIRPDTDIFSRDRPVAQIADPL